MSTRLTLFTATLVQDSALSVSGVDRENSADQPFTIVDGRPVLAGRGLKGAAVAMARRFFARLPRSVSEERDRSEGLRRSAWEFAPARPSDPDSHPLLRAGVGILQKTGARAPGVLYDREVISSGARWSLVMAVNWRLGGDEAEQVEGILGYVLQEHWAEERCWLGGGTARGLGWCHIKDLQAVRLDQEQHRKWLRDRTVLPSPESTIPTVSPTRAWYFGTLDVTLRFGPYQPDGHETAWGVDMLAVGPHDAERGSQQPASGRWASPAWVEPGTAPAASMQTDRAILLDRGAPLLPGSSVRGPLRHAFSRRTNAAAGRVAVRDPHLAAGDVGENDPAGQIFGTVNHSSRVLIRDARVEGAWSAARLHMHAEDEFSAGSYGSAKRDAVRVLEGSFPVRIVVEGPSLADASPLVAEIDRLVALGKWGHLPVGGHKTRGAGWGRWESDAWDHCTIEATGAWEPTPDTPKVQRAAQGTPYPAVPRDTPQTARIEANSGSLPGSTALTLGHAACLAAAALGEPPAAWWCEPSIDFGVTEAPVTFGVTLPAESELRVDEAMFFTRTAAWRAARGASGWRTLLLREVADGTPGSRAVEVVFTPARLHADGTRFAAKFGATGGVLIRQWLEGGSPIGFTLEVRAGESRC